MVSNSRKRKEELRLFCKEGSLRRGGRGSVPEYAWSLARATSCLLDSLQALHWQSFGPRDGRTWT